MNYICSPCIELSVVLKKAPKAELYHAWFCSKTSSSHYFNPSTSTHESPEPFYVATSCINILSKVTLSLAFQGSPWKCQGLPRLDWGILVDRQLGHQLKYFSSVPWKNTPRTRNSPWLAVTIESQCWYAKRKKQKLSFLMISYIQVQAPNDSTVPVFAILS